MENPKQQVIERIRQSTNVLVTVSNNPSVDQLAAAIGLTIFLNKLGKHATTVFSGQVPSILEFLQPEKTIEKTTDSLRDFIIALDKSKADKLRYKVEDKLVKIFITPYHTSIGEKDLEFSHGDFNVDAVVALGVQKREELDQAITAHGRILHDATVLTINTKVTADIGVVNWSDATVSSLCEMVYGIAESLQVEAIDGQMATAFLTGIVAETKRFSNEKTTSATMAISSKLMASGANQQLVATKLQEAVPNPVVQKAEDDSFKLPQGAGAQVTGKRPAEVTIAPVTELPKPVNDDGALSIDHGVDKVSTPLDSTLADEDDDVEEIHIDDQGTLKYATDLAKESAGKPSHVTTDSGVPPQPITNTPSLGSALGGNPQPENPDLSTDPLTQPVSTTNTEPLLTRSPSVGPAPSTGLPTVEPLKKLDDFADETLTDIEQSVQSPHLRSLDTPPPSPGADTPSHLDQARQAVSSAVESLPSTPDPIVSLNANPIDLQIGNQPLSLGATPPSIEPQLSPLPSPPLDNTSIPSDLPPGLVPPSSPIDTTASPTDNAAAPPPVPPPMTSIPLPPPPPTTTPPPSNPLFPQQ